MKSIRSFIAIDLSDQIKTNIATCLNPLFKDKKLAIRWVPLQNIHLTLKFLGDVSPETIENIKKSLFNILNQTHKFSMTIKDMGTFPSIQRPRIVWIGVHVNKELTGVFHHVENVSMKFGVKPEHRKFNPHLTVGRVKNNCSINDLQYISKQLSSMNIDLIGDQIVNEIVIYKSILSPEGAAYYPMVKIPLIG